MRIAAVAAALVRCGRCGARGALRPGRLTAPAIRHPRGPLVLLAQGDALVASTPARPGDPPEGASLRLRRVRVGEDVGRRPSSACAACWKPQQADGARDALRRRSTAGA